MWKQFVEWLKARIKKELEPPKDDPVKPKPEPTPVPSNSIEFLKQVKWLGKNYSNCTEVTQLRSATMSSSSLRINPAPPSDWPTTTVKVTVQAIICLFYERGSEIVGGKFDWCRPGQASKGLENVHSGYKGHSTPAPGARCWTMIVDVNEKHRSNVQEVVRS